MEIIRAISVDLGENLVFYLSYQYHTEKDPQDPEGQRNDKSKSRYRMLGRVDTVENIEKAIQELHADQNRVNPWKWPDDPSWDGKILYMKDSTNEGHSNWLRLKLRKKIGPAEAARVFAGYKKDTKAAAEAKKRGVKPRPEELYSVFVKNAVYETEGYTCTDGTVLDITDFEALKAKKGQNVWKEIHMKLAGKAKGA
jgi:hypothetical protein